MEPGTHATEADNAQQLGQGEAACPSCGRPDVVAEDGRIEPHNVYGLASPCDSTEEILMPVNTVTSVTATVERMIYNYPSLFANRTQVLRHLLCVPGNGYEWEAGRLVSVFIEPDRSDEDVQWQAPDWAEPAMVAEYAEQNAERLEIRRSAAELARTAGPLERVVLESGNSLLPLPLPDDAVHEWRDAATEYEATVRELHSWWVS